MLKLDKTDIRLLTALQHDSSQNIRMLAKKTGMPMSTVHNRIKNYKKEGLIKKSGVVIDDAQLGSYITALILIETKKVSESSMSDEAIADKLAKIAHIQECHIIQGTYDIIVKIKAPSLKDVQEIANQISSTNSVANIDTFIALKTRKETTRIEL